MTAVNRVAALRGSWTLIHLMATFGLLPCAARAQTDEEVREAVANCIGLASENDKARDQLKAWGDSALPSLGKLASVRGSAANLQLVVAIGTIRTQAAADLLLTMVERGDPSPFDHALDHLKMFAGSEKTRPFVDSDRCKQAVFAKATSTRSWLELEHVAEFIGEMRWKDGLPIVRDMLKHPNLEVRRTAARVVRDLTGEVVVIEEVPFAFPGDDFHDGVIELIGAVSETPWSSGAVTFVSRGADPREQQLLYVSDDETLLLDDRLKPVDDLPLRSRADQCLLLPTESGAEQVIVRTSQNVPGAVDEILAFDMSGNVRWRFGEDGQDAKTMTPLVHRGEVLGLVIGIGGERGVVALDLGGSVLWTLPRRYVVYEVLSHPALPSAVAICGGDVEVVDALGRPIESTSGDVAAVFGRVLGSRSLWDGRPYASHAALFPDSQGRVAAIIAGSGDDSVPTIVRGDHEGQTVWSATLPQRVEALTCLDVTGGARLFTVVTETGALLVFDEDGVFLSSLQIEPATSGSGRYGIVVKDVQTGRLGLDLAVAVTTSSGTKVYRIKR